MNNFPSLSGKKIVVTGGGRGIGFGLCIALDEMGADVLTVSREFEPNCFDGTRVKMLALNLTGDDAAEKTLQFALDQLGGVDGLVNNAAMMIKERLHKLTSLELRQVLALNVEANHAISSEFARYWIKTPQDASIVNVSSYLAHRAIISSAFYSASKLAVESLTQSMALEWGRYGIRTNAIAPGWVHTSMTDALLDSAAGAILKNQNPMRRLGEIDDIVGPVAFLLSDQARYINGAILTVDGGQRLA